MSFAKDDGKREGVHLNRGEPAGFVRCPRCGSEVYTEGMFWPGPEEHLPGELVSRWISCPVEAGRGGDPLGEFDDGEPCGEGFVVQRRVSANGSTWAGPPSLSVIVAGWMTPWQIAKRWCEVTSMRVEQLIKFLGLEGSRTHSRGCSIQTLGEHNTVVTYSPSAVGLIERELLSRGLRRCEALS